MLIMYSMSDNVLAASSCRTSFYWINYVKYCYRSDLPCWAEIEWVWCTDYSNQIKITLN